MKILVIFCTLFNIFNVSFAQKDSIKLYYQNLNKAELAIVDSNYVNALKYYDTAFCFKKNPFGRDLYNATLTSIMIKSYPRALAYLEKLFSLGFNLKTLDTINICKDFLASSFGKVARKKHKELNVTYNRKYRSEIKKMLHNDQFFRVKENGYERFGDTIRMIDRQNVEHLLKLITKYGFPSEDKIGIDPENIMQPLFYVLVFHQNSGARYQTFNYSAILKTAILKGELRNNVGADLMQGADGVRDYDAFGLVMAKFDTSVSEINDAGLSIKKVTSFQTNWGYFKIDDTEQIKINQKRQLIFLEPLEQNLKKMAYSLKTNVFLFDCNAKSIFKYSTYKDFTHAKENIIYP